MIGSKQTIHRTLVTFYALDSAATCFMYGFGFSALYTHAVDRYNSLNLWLLITIVTKIALSYLNVLHIFVSVLKMVLYLYSRLLLSILYTVLVIPRDL